jgi:hypothetical protein
MRASKRAVLSLSKGSAPLSAWLGQCVGSGFGDGVIVLYAASADADCSDDLAVQLQRDAARERTADPTTLSTYPYAEPGGRG